MDESKILSWVHFGDLHITHGEGQNYRDFLLLINDANQHLGKGGVNFAFLPGDNAENGTEAQYQLIGRAIAGLRIPLHAIPGDHDIQSGSLESFRSHLCPEIPKGLKVGPYRCVFLNAVDSAGGKGFGFQREQLAWLAGELRNAILSVQRPAVFLHNYPSELGESAATVRKLLHEHHVRLVEMGHTHYNEIANDGCVLYAATRSTGQIEEGAVGFSITNVDDGVVSWKFKALEQPWPFVMITSPSDLRLLTDPPRPSHLVRGALEVRAKAWSAKGVSRALCRIDDGPWQSMFAHGAIPIWKWEWDSHRYEDGPHLLRVRVQDKSGAFAEDAVMALSNQSGQYIPPSRFKGDDANAIGAYPEKGILGTQLGPNKNGHPW